MTAPHMKTIWISAVVSALAAAPIGWLASSLEMGQTVANSAGHIAVMETEIDALNAQNRARVTREEFAHMQQEQAGHWAEEHDFFVRQDQRTDEIVRDHARIMAFVEAREKAEKKAAWPAGGLGD